MIVNGYERHKSEPSLTFNTGYENPIQLVHIVNVLVFESVGGSADQAFVFTFHDGKPSVALHRSTAGGIAVTRGSSAVVMRLPVKTYPATNGKFPHVPDANYSFALE